MCAIYPNGGIARLVGACSFQALAALDDHQSEYYRTAARPLFSHVRFQAVSVALFVPGIAGSRKDRRCRAWQEAERHGRYIPFQLAEVTIVRSLFTEILRLIDGLPACPTAPP